MGRRRRSTAKLGQTAASSSAWRSLQQQGGCAPYTWKHTPRFAAATRVLSWRPCCCGGRAAVGRLRGSRAAAGQPGTAQLSAPPLSFLTNYTGVGREREFRCPPPGVHAVHAPRSSFEHAPRSSLEAASSSECARFLEVERELRGGPAWFVMEASAAGAAQGRGSCAAGGHESAGGVQMRLQGAVFGARPWRPWVWSA